MSEVKQLEMQLRMLRDELSHIDLPTDVFSKKLDEIHAINRKLTVLRFERFTVAALLPLEKKVATQEHDRAIALEAMGIPHLASRRADKLRRMEIKK